MKIRTIHTYLQRFELTRPYKIAYKTQTTVENVILEITTDTGNIGLGAASPVVEITGESFEDCLQALNPVSLSWCIGKEISDFTNLRKACFNKLSTSPAACAALDMALHDLYAQMLDKPLVEVLGRKHYSMPTSITIGIKNIEETIKEAAEYISRGFKVLKVKLGCSLDEDIARLRKLREHFGNHVYIRVDPNQGYTLAELITFIKQTEKLNIEMIEQPLKANLDHGLGSLSEANRKIIALDESILTVKDALRVLNPTPRCGIFNIKLMKCGGIYAAQEIAQIAEAANVKLMWGCMDESIISISAALHVAFASKATSYIDLDGSLDLAQDIVVGGFTLKDGMMTTTECPGLGVLKI